MEQKVNDLFMSSLDKLAQQNPDRKNLIEAVKKVYINCEAQAQLEMNSLQKAAAIGGLGLALGGAAGYGLHDDIDSAKNAVSDKLTEIAQDADNYYKFQDTQNSVMNRNNSAYTLEDKGWKYVPRSTKQFTSDSLNGMPLDELDKRKGSFGENLRTGVHISPDSTKIYSDVTGNIYETPVDENGKHINAMDDRVNRDNRGTLIGNGILMSGDVKDDEVPDCSVDTFGKYGNVGQCDLP